MTLHDEEMTFYYEDREKYCKVLEDKNFYIKMIIIWITVFIVALIIGFSIKIVRT